MTAELQQGQCYRIANWQTIYEKSQGKRVQHMRWVPIPNKHDGLGYRKLIEGTKETIIRVQADEVIARRILRIHEAKQNVV